MLELPTLAAFLLALQSKKPSKLHLKSNHIKKTCRGVLVCRTHEKFKSKELPLIIIVLCSKSKTKGVTKTEKSRKPAAPLFLFTDTGLCASVPLE